MATWAVTSAIPPTSQRRADLQGWTIDGYLVREPTGDEEDMTAAEVDRDVFEPL
jgi:hypothetical protein